MLNRMIQRTLLLISFVAVLCVAVLCTETTASAQYSVPSQTSRTEPVAVAGGRLGTARGKVEKKLVSPTHWEVGASLNFLTSGEPSLGGEPLAFTDVALLRLHGLVSVAGKVEIFGGVDVLPKQPSYTNELAWQGALLGARTSLGDSFAVWVRSQGGPQLSRAGYWFSGDLAVQYKLALEEILFFESSLGWAHTQLLYDIDVERVFFIEEVFGQVGIALRDSKKGQFGIWLNFDYFVPVLSGPDANKPDPLGGALDPQPRINMHLGGLIGLSQSVDLFVEYSILDRGDLENGMTTLPILNTGFDQRQILFGFMRRFMP